MSRPIRPSAAPWSPSAWFGWVIVAVAAVVLLASTTMWLTGQVATRVTTGVWPRTDWSALLLFTVGGDTEKVWPAVSPTTIWLVTTLTATAVLVVVTAPWMRWWARRPSSDEALRALARPREVADLTLPARREQAVRLRPSLADVSPRRIDPRDVGLAVGDLVTGPHSTGPTVYAGWEDVAVAIMAPRSGKTTALTIPLLLDAPGPVVATSNKADLLLAAKARQRRTRKPVHVFDPQQLALSKQKFWWNPLASVTSVEHAERLAGHFFATMPEEKTRIWGQSATELLGGLLLAAALDGQPLTRVYDWLTNEHVIEPIPILQAAGFDQVARSVQSLSGLAHETRSSVYFTARAATACLRNPQIMAWVTPDPDLPEFRTDDFITTRETLYLLSKDSGGSAAPLVAALADAAIRSGIAAAEAAGGRCDPPMTVILDEAASVAPIADLPLLVSHAGSRAIFVLTILQSFPQGTAVWKDQGMKALWSAATIKIIGPGQDDTSFNEGVSKLLGEQWVTTTSYSSAAGPRGSSATTNVTRARVMDAAQLRGLPRGTAVLIATGYKAALVRLRPWYASAAAAELKADEKAMTAAIAAAAGRSA